MPAFQQIAHLIVIQNKNEFATLSHSALGHLEGVLVRTAT
ncbi:hypothetical protein LT85_3401 [Collimonas arenae]|uniref:Uncharacterized protein n=1 Tax=Collimonas arenae TaxID=279058 RepID=A0A0A1FFV5_9BURK|nr:hypothetical protein LT85_3401 [Collimonas arenae]